MNIKEIAGKLHYLTSGYPFLVSRLCKIIDEEIQPLERWDFVDIDTAFNLLLKEDNTNFQSLIKNLENNRSLYEMVSRIVLEGENIGYNLDNPVIEQGVTHGVFRDDNGRLTIHNRVYEQRIYNYMASKVETSLNMGHYNFRGHFLDNSGNLNMKEVLFRFQNSQGKRYLGPSYWSGPLFRSGPLFSTIVSIFDFGFFFSNLLILSNFPRAERIFPFCSWLNSSP
jgi:hypothetical protein